MVRAISKRKIEEKKYKFDRNKIAMKTIGSYTRA